MHNVGKFATFDVSPATSILGVEFRDPKQTIKDTVQWVVEAGHVA